MRDENSMRVQLKDALVIQGEPMRYGEVIEVDPHTGLLLVMRGQAVESALPLTRKPAPRVVEESPKPLVQPTLWERVKRWFNE